LRRCGLREAALHGREDSVERCLALLVRLLRGDIWEVYISRRSAGARVSRRFGCQAARKSERGRTDFGCEDHADWTPGTSRISGGERSAGRGVSHERALGYRKFKLARTEVGVPNLRSGPFHTSPSVYRKEKDTGQLTNLTVSRSLANWRGLTYIQRHVLHTGQADRFFGGD
jgi:hypothetical protein